MSFEILAGLICLTIVLWLIVWLYRIYGKLYIKVFDLEFDNKDLKTRIFSLENSLLTTLLNSLSNLSEQTEQKQTEQKDCNYGTIKLSNPEITKEIVNEIAETNSRKTLFDDIWKIKPPVKI